MNSSTNDLRGLRVLVTGAGGFIGANLVRELLRAGAEVHGLVRTSTGLWRLTEVLGQITLHQVDLTREEQLKRTVNGICPDAVFNLAVNRSKSSQDDYSEILISNIRATANLLDATAPFNYQRFVNVGSSTEYGKKNEPIRESDSLEPLTLHAVSKAAATLLCQQFAKVNGKPLVTLRLFSVYGYWEAPARLIPTAILAALRSKGMALTPPGYRHDWVFVEDVVEACLLAIRSDKVNHEIINIGSGEQWANEEAVNMIQDLSQRTIEMRPGGYPANFYDSNCWVANIEKAKRLLGWSPRHTLSQGLQKTISWFRLHEDSYE